MGTLLFFFFPSKNLGAFAMAVWCTNDKKLARDSARASRPWWQAQILPPAGWREFSLRCPTGSGSGEAEYLQPGPRRRKPMRNRTGSCFREMGIGLHGSLLPQDTSHSTISVFVRLPDRDRAARVLRRAPAWKPKSTTPFPCTSGMLSVRLPKRRLPSAEAAARESLALRSIRSSLRPNSTMSSARSRFLRKMKSLRL